MSYQSHLTKSLSEYAERLRARMNTVGASCEDGVEPLATIECDWVFINKLVKQSERCDKAFQIALDCVKAIPELDTSPVSALGERFKRPVESAEHTLYLLRHMGFVDMKAITEVMSRVPTNPATLVSTGKVEP